MALEDARVKVLAHFQEQGSVVQGTAEGLCERFEVEVALQSGEPEVEIAELIRMARRMCFTESALMGQVALSHKYTLNGRTIDSPG